MVTVSMTRAARMCNQLFQYAMLRSVAEKNGYNFYIDPDLWYGHDLFDCDLGKKDGHITNDFHELPGQKFNPEVFNASDFTCFQGYWQSEKYFSRDDVKEWFKPIEKQSVWDFRRRFPVGDYCYINVRGTDQRLWHMTLPKEYYDDAIEIMLNFNRNLRFVVITDDVPLAEEYFPSLQVFSNDRDTDFCLLHGATYLIGAISTFAWWAGYLNDYNVCIFPKHFYHHKTQGVEGCNGWGPMDIHTQKFIWI
jgi:hypothetical protein